MDEPPSASKAERKKARRKQKREAERVAARQLDTLAEQAIAEALRLAPEVADAPNQAASERLIDVPVDNLDAARYLRKRINEVLVSGEWLEDVNVWVWESGVHKRDALGDAGRTHGVELRLEQPRLS